MMKKLLYEATRKTPKILFDSERGIFEISGRSIPENAFEFFKPVLEWLDDYSSVPLRKTVLKVFLEYYNTSSSKYLLDIFKKFEFIYREHHEVKIEWFYDEDEGEEDDDMLKAGKHYGSMLKIPFETKKCRLSGFQAVL